MSLTLVLSFIAGALLVWWWIEKSRRRSRPMAGGLHQNINLAHQHAVELYSNPFSHCARKVRLALAERGIDYHRHDIDLVETGWYQTLSPDYLKVNPAGAVPVLVHHGHPIYESDEIIKYVNSLTPDDAQAAPINLIPENTEKRSDMERWINFCTLQADNILEDADSKIGACVPGLTVPLFIVAIREIPLRRIVTGLLFHPDKRRPLFFSLGKLLGLKRTLSLPQVSKILDLSRNHIAQHLKHIDDALANTEGDWILGEEYSLADLTISCVLLRLDEVGWLEQLSQQTELANLNAYYRRLKTRASWEQAIESCHHRIIFNASKALKREVLADSATRRLIYQV